MVYAAKRMGLGGNNAKKASRKHERKYPELTVPGEKVQIDVKEVPYCCLRGELKRNGKHLYQLYIPTAKPQLHGLKTER